MTRTERFYKIDQMLHERRMVLIEVFLEELDVSRATFQRDMKYLRDRLHAPIVWDRDAGGYRFERLKATGPAYELPGLWFSSGELYALLAAHKLLGDIAPGILASHVAPLQARLAALLESSGHSASEITQRVRLLSMAKRTMELRFFTDITIALLERKRIEIDAWNRGRNETNTRTVSPQRLMICAASPWMRFSASKCYGKKRAMWHRPSSMRISLRFTGYLVVKPRLGRSCAFCQNAPVGCSPSAGTANNRPKCLSMAATACVCLPPMHESC